MEEELAQSDTRLFEILSARKVLKPQITNFGPKMAFEGQKWP